MKKLLLAALVLAASVAGVNAQSIGIAVFEDGSLILSSGFITGGFQSVTGGNADFSIINVTASGTPLTAPGDFGTVNLDISANSFTGTHTLTVLATQVGNSNQGQSSLEFASNLTSNFLINPAGLSKVTMQNFSDALDRTFMAGAVNALTPAEVFGGTGGSLLGLLGNTGPLSGLFSETTLMSATFVGGGAELQTTAQISSVPEPATWAMLLLGFCGLGFAFRRKLQVA